MNIFLNRARLFHEIKKFDLYLKDYISRGCHFLADIAFKHFNFLLFHIDFDLSCNSADFGFALSCKQPYSGRIEQNTEIGETI